ncbi:MAG: phenylacetate--CoA ligase family protein [Mycobacteriales bacterium]
MATHWDMRTAEEMSKRQDSEVRRQVLSAIAPFSPFWRTQFPAAGIRPATIKGAADLRRIPAVGERELCPDGDPAGAARLVLQVDEAGYAAHAAGPDYREALLLRVARPAAYRRQVEAATRPVSYHLGGLGLRFPIASTRGDLDLMARAGARAWAVLGLTAADLLVSVQSTGTSLEATALAYAALGAGAPAVHGGLDVAREVLRYLPATVLAVPDAATLDALEVDLRAITTVLVTRDSSGVAARVPQATVLRLWGPPDGRVVYAQCRAAGPAGGFHTYPDLEVLDIVDPATGEDCKEGGELVVTQLGFRGSALLRWRTGTVLPASLERGPCPGCGRSVPRLPSGLVPGAAVPRLALRGGQPVPVDLRAVAGALAGRSDLAGWLVDVCRSGRDGSPQLILRLRPPPGPMKGRWP